MRMTVAVKIFKELAKKCSNRKNDEWNNSEFVSYILSKF